MDGCQSLAAREGTSRSLVFRVASVIGFSHQNITDFKNKKKQNRFAPSEKEKSNILLKKRKRNMYLERKYSLPSINRRSEVRTVSMGRKNQWSRC